MGYLRQYCIDEELVFTQACRKPSTGTQTRFQLKQIKAFTVKQEQLLVKMNWVFNIRV